MTSLLVPGFVQIWSKKTGMTKSKEAFIEIVEGKKKDKLVIHFSAEEVIKAFQLTNNIRNIVFRFFGGNQNHFHVTFQNNSFLFIDRLSYSDAEQLKMFLDKHQNKFQPSMELVRDGGIFSGAITQKEIETTFHSVSKKTHTGSLETAKGSAAAILQNLPSFTSISSTHSLTGLLESGHKKSKRKSSRPESNEDFLKKDNSVLDKKSIAYPLRYISHTQEKPVDLKGLKDKRKVKFGTSFETRPTGNCHLHSVRFMKALSRKSLLTFLFEPKYNHDGLEEWEEHELSFDFFPDKQLQGFPNLGNTCYMNAVLQTLFSIPSFGDDLLYQSIPWGKVPFSGLILCLAQLLVLRNLYNIRVKEKLLLNIKRAIAAVAKIFSENIQNDAHEFLGHCLDQMKENMKTLQAVWESKCEFEKRNSPQQAFADSAASKVLICPVTTNFEFELKCSITCKACGQVVLKREPSNYLSINLPQGAKGVPMSLQSSLDLFFEAEELEYRCGKCEHERSLATHIFSRLPRVLIVHLKRYGFSGSLPLGKNEQNVIVPTYLNLSSHCNESTKPPLPLGSYVYTENSQAEKVFEKMNSGTISPVMPSTKLASESKDPLTLCLGSDKEAETQKCQGVFKGLSREQQDKNPGKDSKLNITESELVSSRLRAVSEKELLARASVTYEEDLSLSLIRKDGNKTISSLGAGLSQVHFQRVSENPELTKYKKPNMFSELDSDCARIPEGFQKVVVQPGSCDGVKLCGHFSEQAWSPSPQKPAQGHTDNLRRHTELSLQEAKVKLLGALGSCKNSGNTDILDRKNKEAEAEEQEKAQKIDPHAYRLISIISHLGSSLHSGHYVSHIYDFERQLWFTFSDLQVTIMKETQRKGGERLSTGYIFFYMHNEIFEELSRREENSELHSTNAGENCQEG
ncbi:ubiquitin carboxyl-terminal hydrolase 26 [Loxodonta africana]|uniref:Ubiquitin carboxyl-terminal hydrolase n=1 Tax=Loxodonta africana TaxID=9785 RepID=G3UJ37_LOXAF|nr:ubiquitin carboxyl-terminal hydrolase 26 [Loxodonta africana]